MRSKLYYALMSFACVSACYGVPNNNAPVEQTYLQKYGVKVRPDYWHSVGQNGQVLTTLRNGVRVSQTFANGMLNGESTYTFPNSDKLEKLEVHNNDVLVKQVFYHTSGIPYKSTEYSAPDIYTETVWYDTGHPKSVEKFERGMLVNGEYYNEKNQRDSWIYNGIGERLTRDDYGHFLSLDAFRGGQMVLRTTYYPNGSPQEIIPYTNGIINGERKTYYPGGEPMAIENWNNGIQNGITVIYQNGEKFAEVPYLNGKKNGIEKRFKDGSSISQEITWYDGKMHGPTFTYVGKSTQTDWFWRGRLTTRSDFEAVGFPRRKGA